MFLLKSLAFFICAIISFSEARFVDTLNKCSIKDNDCQGNTINSAMQSLSESGAKELGIPTIDPFEIKDIKVSVMDLMELHAIEGKVKGLKDCVVEKYTTDIGKGHSEMTLLCNSLTVKAKYKISGSSPIVKNLFGGESISGDGNCKVKIEKLKFKFDYFYDVEKNKDGDVFFNCKFNKTIYTYELLGKVSFAADKIMLGDKDATELVVGFLNENSKFMVNNFGKPFMDKAMEFVYNYMHMFFSVVPAKYYIQDDLSQYVKS